jgi:drug/metabolite transporter, DME family
MTSSGPTRTAPPGLEPAGLLGALIATASWALTGTFIHMVPTVPAPLVAAIRLAISAAGLLGFRVLQRHLALWPRVPWPPVVAMAAYYVLATEAFTRAPVVEVTLVVGSAPVITLAVEAAMGRRVRPRQALGVLIAIAGLAAFLVPAMRDAPRSVLGYVFALGAAGMSALYVTSLRARAAQGSHVDVIAIATRASVVGAIGSVLTSIGREGTFSASISARDLALLALLGVVSTAVPTVAYGEASKRLPPAVTTSLSLLTPLFAALVAGVTLGEWPALSRLPGCVLAFIGICAVVLSG